MTTVATTKWISTADTAKLIRADLKAAFPTIKFKVTSKRYSGGSSIDIYWVDGPTTGEINAVTNSYLQGSYDMQEDLYRYRHDQILNGERVSYMAKYIFGHRSYSVPFAQAVSDKLTTAYGLDRFEVKESAWGADYSGAYAVKLDRQGYVTLQDRIGRALEGKEY